MIRVTDKGPEAYSLQQLREDRNVSVREEVSDKELARFGVYRPVREVPEALAVGEVLSDPVYENRQGVWYETVAVEKMPAHVLRQHLSAVTQRQLRIALLRAGLEAPAPEALVAPEGASRAELEIEWVYGERFQRNSAVALALQATLALTDDQLDEVFKLAADI